MADIEKPVRDDDYSTDPGVESTQSDKTYTEPIKGDEYGNENSHPHLDYSEDTDGAPSREERAKGVGDDSIVPGSTTSLPPSNEIKTGDSGVSDDAPKTENTGALADAPEVYGPTPVTPAESDNKDEGPVEDDFERIVPSTDGPPPAEQTISQDTRR